MKKLAAIQAKIVFCLILFLVVSCHKDKTTQTTETTVTEQEVVPLMSENFEQLLADRTRLAKSLSIAMNDKDFHHFISQKCIESKLGDAEVLYANVVDLKIPNKNTTVGVFLASLELKVRSNEEDEFYSKHIVEKDPLLTIVLQPGRDKSRNTLGADNNAKKVYVDKIIDDFKDGQSISYSLSGKDYTETYRYAEEPIDAYFGIKLNEEYIAFDRRNEVIFYNMPKTLKGAGSYIDYNFVKSEQALIRRVGNTVIAAKHKPIVTSRIVTKDYLQTRSSCGLPYERDCANGKDAVHEINFAHDYEGWPRGGPEFIMQYTLGLNNNVTANPNGYQLSNSSRIFYRMNTRKNFGYQHDRDGVPLKDYQLFNWTLPEYSRDMLQHWSEDDGGLVNDQRTTSLTAKIPASPGVPEQTISINQAWSFQRGDDDIGTSIVQYVDLYSPTSQGYQYLVSGSNGPIRFHQRDRGY
jgi:hypothetical protein